MTNPGMTGDRVVAVPCGPPRGRRAGCIPYTRRRQPNGQVKVFFRDQHRRRVAILMVDTDTAKQFESGASHKIEVGP